MQDHDPTGPPPADRPWEAPAVPSPPAPPPPSAYPPQPYQTGPPAWQGPPPGYGYPAAQPNEPLAGAALGCGLGGIVGGLFFGAILPPLGFVVALGAGIAGVVLGRQAKARIVASRGALGGESMATAGLVTGIVAIVVAVLMAILVVVFLMGFLALGFLGS
jgi:hypothetical protein